MDYVTLWFILLGGAGYLPPMEVRNPPCGIAGAVVGVQLDRSTNPTAALWPDPYFPGVHCRVDIRAKVASLAPGEYHVATTEMGKLYPAGVEPAPYIGIDPHTSATWVKTGSAAPPPPPPATMRLQGSGSQLPAARVLEWDPNPPEERVFKYRVSIDGVALPEIHETQQPIVLPAYRSYVFSVVAIDVDLDESAPATLTYDFQAPVPGCVKPSIRVDDWTRIIPLGGRGKVSLTLADSFPITLLQVKLAGQVIGEVTGADLRDLAGLWFSVPRTPGEFNISVLARDSVNCTEQTTAIRLVKVQ